MRAAPHAMRLTSAIRKRVALQLGAAVTALVPLLEGAWQDGDDDFVMQLTALVERAQRLAERVGGATALGRGFPIVQKLPQLTMPRSTMYDDHVVMEDTFQDRCGFSPSEFEDLHNDVLGVLEMCRDVDRVFTEAENALRRRRRYKYSSRERLYHFLIYFRHYPKLRKGSSDMNMSKSALLLDVAWLRVELSTHPLLVAEVQWGTPQELEQERLTLVGAGLLTPPFDDCTFMCDGTKDLCHRSAHYGHVNEPDFSQKGNGRSHLLQDISHYRKKSQTV